MSFSEPGSSPFEGGHDVSPIPVAFFNGLVVWTRLLLSTRLPRRE